MATNADPKYVPIMIKIAVVGQQSVYFINVGASSAQFSKVRPIVNLACCVGDAQKFPQATFLAIKYMKLISGASVIGTTARLRRPSSSFAFLDIMPVTEGHTQIIPKCE